jgi:hypothetical protein
MHTTFTLKEDNSPDYEAIAGLGGTIEAVAKIIAPSEGKRVPTAKAKQRYEAALIDIATRLSVRAIAGRGWEPQPLSNTYLKGAGGPGICVKDIVQRLQQTGLIEFRRGYYDRIKCTGRPSAMRASAKLRAIMAAKGIPLSGGQMPTTTTLLRGGSGKMPSQIKKQDDIIKAFNAMADQRRLGWPDGTVAREVYLVRLFKGDWTMGGRLYGGCWQEMSKAERADLRIDGEPVIELDFVCMQPRILFAKAGLELDFDPYMVPGFDDVDRKVGKLAYNRLANRQGTSTRACPLNFDAAFKPYFNGRSEFVRFVTALQERLSPIAQYFRKDAWGMLQLEESDLMITILHMFMDAGFPAFPIHDSLIVKESHLEFAKKTMLSSFSMVYGVCSHVK